MLPPCLPAGKDGLWTMLPPCLLADTNGLCCRPACLRTRTGCATALLACGHERTMLLPCLLADTNGLSCRPACLRARTGKLDARPLGAGRSGCWQNTKARARSFFEGAHQVRGSRRVPLGRRPRPCQGTSPLDPISLRAGWKTLCCRLNEGPRRLSRAAPLPAPWRAWPLERPGPWCLKRPPRWPAGWRRPPLGPWPGQRPSRR